MSKRPRISEAEWVVMKVLWEHSPRTAGDVVAALASQTQWKGPTVKTMLNRLARKGALKFETQGKRYLYRPAVSRAICQRGESRSFARRVFGGEIASMLAHFVQDSKLSQKQIDELRRLLDEKAR
jgi:BlaI family penicillinase repressor